MPIPSVQKIAVAICFFVLFPLFAQAQLQGKWACASKSGHYDVNTEFQVHCAGTLNFKTDRVLESTCSDGFFPSGCYWERFDQRITLRDSAGKAFADFEIKTLSEENLLLVRNNIYYAFERVKS